MRAMRGKRLSLMLLLLALGVCVAMVAQEKAQGGAGKLPAPPPSARQQVVEEVLHGTRVADPYRWLENNDSPETQEFSRHQMAYTRAVLDRFPWRSALRARLAELLSIGTLTAPDPRGRYYFYTRREGGQNQPVLYAREGLNGTERALVDPNKLAEDATVALDWWEPSEDGKYVAYGTSPGGSEVSTLYLIETASGRKLPDELFTGRGASIAWLPDSSGFYYSRYPKKGEVPAGQEAYNRKIYFHKLGAPQAKDPLVFGEGLDPQAWPSVSLSEDGRWLLVTVSHGWTKSEIFLKDLRAQKAQWVPVTQGKNFLYAAEILGDQFYITTNEDAPRARVFRVAATAPARANWKEIIPQSEGARGAVLQETRLIARLLFTHYQRNAASELRVYSLDGKLLHNVKLPTLGTVKEFGGEATGTEAFFGFESFAVPPTVFRVDLAGHKAPASPQPLAAQEWARVKSDIDPKQFEVRQVWYESKDGTSVPMFLLTRAGLGRSANTPVLLHGYGGFNVSETPELQRAILAFVEAGGMYALANLRGGSEFGEDWHRAGMLEKKQNGFDDFMAAAEFLQREGYTSRERLCAYGRSNGGLLTGAVLTQRPELYRCVVSGVPLLDMLRYQNFQIARLWIAEYGSAENAAQFPYIFKYSPYHNVKEQKYPAVLFFTSEGDTRVDPMHARKMTALMQAKAKNAADQPILLRIEPKAGHGAGKPVSKQIEEWNDIFTFVMWQLGMDPSAAGPMKLQRTQRPRRP